MGVDKEEREENKKLNGYSDVEHGPIIEANR